jgi:hypothetical protein
MNVPDGALARAYEDESNNLADVRVWHEAAESDVRSYVGYWGINGLVVLTLSFVGHDPKRTGREDFDQQMTHHEVMMLRT